MEGQNLKERVLKVIDLGKQIFVFSTVDEEGRPHARYMGVIGIDDDYSAFFLGCRTASNKVRHLEHNPHAQLLFATPDYLQVAALSGSAQMVGSLEAKRRFWDDNPVLAGYFKAFDDPEFGMIRFVPEYAEYLDLNKDFETVRVEWRQPEAVPAQ